MWHSVIHRLQLLRQKLSFTTSVNKPDHICSVLTTGKDLNIYLQKVSDWFNRNPLPYMKLGFYDIWFYVPKPQQSTTLRPPAHIKVSSLPTQVKRWISKYIKAGQSYVDFRGTNSKYRKVKQGVQIQINF